MTHQPNKHFKTYKEGLDLEVLREYCMEHGERRTFVAYVERGCFKYMVHRSVLATLGLSKNDEDGKDYCTSHSRPFAAHQRNFCRLVIFCLQTLMGVLLSVVAPAQEVIRLTTEQGLSANSVKSFFRDSHGLMYIGTSVGVDRYDGERVVNIPFPVDDVREDCWVSGMVEVDDGMLLVGNNIGLWSLDCRRLTLTRVFSDIINCEVENLWQTSDGRVLVGTHDATFQVDRRDITRLQQLQMPPHVYKPGRVFSFLRDDDGVEWRGYLYTGLDYSPFDRHIFETFRLPGVFDSQGHTVRSHLHENGRHLIGCEDGLFIVSEQEGTVTTYDADILGNACVMGIAHVGIYYVIATHGSGITLLNAATLQPVTFPGHESLDNAHVYQISTDRRGRVWLCTTSGLFLVDLVNRQVRHFTARNSQLPDDEVFCGNVDSRGRGWFSTRGGLCTSDAATDELSVRHLPQQLVQIDMLRDISWLGDTALVFLPQHGFPVLTDSSVTRFRTLAFDILETSPRINFFCGDGRHYFFSTERAMYVADGNGLCRTCSHIDGLQDISVMAKYAVVDSTRRLWMGCRYGLVSVQVDSLTDAHRKHFPIVINQIQNDHWYSESEVACALYDGQIRTSLLSNDLTLHFVPLVYGHTADLRFRYRLEGDEPEWHIANHGRQICYNGLWPGRYTLCIEAIGQPEIHARITITVLPTLTLLGCVVAVLLLLAGLWRLLRSYRRALRRAEQLRRKHELELTLAARHAVAERDREMADRQAAEEAARQETLYQKNRITDSEARQLLRRVRAYMDEGHPYHRQDLRLSEVAAAIGTNATRLSQVFNQHLGQNFFDFVNAYRIEDFKRRSLDPHYAQLTLTAIAEQCGFKRSSFFTAFKRAEGCTPTEWLEQKRAKQSPSILSGQK